MASEKQTYLPQDKAGASIQTLAPDESTVVELTIGADSRIALPANARVVEVAATGVCRIRFGDSGVTAAGGRVFPAGISVYKVPETDVDGTRATHIAAVQIGASTGTVTVARMY